MIPNKTQLFRISSSQAVYSTLGQVDSQRFLTDVNYLTHFASGIADCLGARTIQCALVEDAHSQTAFYYTGSPDGIGSVVNGVFTQKKRRPSEVLDQLLDD